jgi:predicted metal-dependent phosphoesterase TrpH
MRNPAESSETYSTPPRSARECKYWWFDQWDRLVNGALSLAGSPHISVGAGEIAIDPHIHTLFSHCSISRPEGVLVRASKIGLGGVAIMDHHTVKGALDTLRCADHLKRRGELPEDFVVIPGVELNSSVGHIGALFVREDLPEGLTPEETVRVIHEAGGLAVAPHPYHSTGIREAVFDAPFDAVEVECGSVFASTLVKRNAELASDPRLASITKLGSSDSHYLRGIGHCYTVLTVSEQTLDAARQAIVEGRSAARSSEPCRRMRRMLGWIPKLR